MCAAGNEVVTRAFRRRACQDRRFDINKTMGIQKGTQGLGNTRTQTDFLLHLRPAQIDIAIAQAHFLINVLVFQLKRWCFCGIQYLQLQAQHLYRARRHIRINGALGTVPHASFHLQYIFITHPLRHCKGGLGIRVKHHLQQPLVITQIDKDDTTVITAAVYPATQGDFLVEVGFVQFTTVETAHSVSSSVSNAKTWSARSSAKSGEISPNCWISSSLTCHPIWLQCLSLYPAWVSCRTAPHFSCCRS